MKNQKVDETLIGYGNEKNWNFNYRGGRNPHRKGSYNYELWETDKDWWMENLNIDMIRDYLQDLDWKMNSMKFNMEHSEELKELFGKSK